MVAWRAFLFLPREAFGFLLTIAPALVVMAPPIMARAEPTHQFPTSPGPTIYQERCASCHGLSGKGDGPAAPALKAAPPDLTTITRRAGGTFPAARVFQVITHGGSISAHGSQSMPVWGKIFSVEAGRGERGALHSRRAVLQLKRYLESLQRN
jgi:mono/diheme cytochrome c family protein